MRQLSVMIIMIIITSTIHKRSSWDCDYCLEKSFLLYKLLLASSFKHSDINSLLLLLLLLFPFYITTYNSVWMHQVEGTNMK